MKEFLEEKAERICLLSEEADKSLKIGMGGEYERCLLDIASHIVKLPDEMRGACPILDQEETLLERLKELSSAAAKMIADLDFYGIKTVLLIKKKKGQTDEEVSCLHDLIV